MDDLPKNNNSKTNDWSTLSGVYPETNKDTGIAKSGLVSSPEPQKPVSVPLAEKQQVVTTPFANTEIPPVTTVETPSNSNFPEINNTESNPFLVEPAAVSPSIPVPLPQTGSPKPSGGGIVKRILMILILFIVIGALGYGAFYFVGSSLTKPKTITLTYWGLWESEEIIKPLIDEYKKSHPNVEIAYSKQSHKDYRERLQNSINVGTGPDIFRFHNTWVPMFTKELMPAGKTGYTPEEFKTTFYPVANTDLILSNKVYGVPLMIDGLGLYYNEDLLRVGGVTPPTTWDEFKTAAQKLTVKSNEQIVTSGSAFGLAGNIEHFSDIVGLLMLQSGASLTKINSQQAIDALSFYRLFSEKPNNVWDNKQDNSITAFASGKVAMIFAPSWQVFEIKEQNPELNFKVIPVPQLTGGNTTWASYWVEGVSAKTKYPDEAWSFLKFLSEKESMITLYTEQAKLRAFGEPYSRVDLAQTIVNDPYVGAYVKQAQTAKSFFLCSRTHDNGINDRLIDNLEIAVDSLEKGISPEEALDTASKGFAQVLSGFGYSAP